MIRRYKFSTPVFWSSVFIAHCLHSCPSLLFGSSFSFDHHPHLPSSARKLAPIKLFAAGYNNNDNKPDEDGSDIESSSSTLMSKSSFLSHVMLKVPSVDDSLSYWTEKGGTIRISRNNGKTNGEAKLLSAFVEMGYDQNIKSNSKKRKENIDVIDIEQTSNTEVEPSSACFALELVRTEKEEFSVGNVIAYVGVSMLLQFRNNLIGAILGDEKTRSQGLEPNGIPVCSSASAPGDYFARFCLKAKDVSATSTFYTTILGMTAMAEDDRMTCLRYDNASFRNGVATTLVFDFTAEDLDKGDCFDHIAITTSSPISTLYDEFEKAGCTVFMKPTSMFGKQVCGLLDPNGYKVVIAEI
jgi:catechol 2,3-dioxygenase-like lactoylglutathione lyase family enzyme